MSLNDAGGQSFRMVPYFDCAGELPVGRRSLPTNSALGGRNLVLRRLTVTLYFFRVSKTVTKYAMREMMLLSNRRTSSTMTDALGSVSKRAAVIFAWMSLTASFPRMASMAALCSLMMAVSLSIACFGSSLYNACHSFLKLTVMHTKNAWALRIPIGITNQCFFPSGVKKAVRSLESSWSFTCQYPASRSMVMKNFASPTVSTASSHLRM
mmetsp:Transcript_13152/g.31140  ORF Transcript_13152/g.31140 Transcript_13152/m.31140 type:complete len:210 (+) Transcript_13152:4416-5045(+)